MDVAVRTSTGLSPRFAAALAYAGWWVTGLIFYALEQDPYARFHAAQSVTAFGLITLFIIGFLTMAAASLSFLPTAFSLFLWAAAVTWIAGVMLWIVAMWKAATGDAWRIPVAATLADRLL